MTKKNRQAIVPEERIERSILLLRGKRVILDADLAYLYGVSTARLDQQVRRNIDRFPEDFAFLLTPDEFGDLKLHFAASSMIRSSALSSTPSANSWCHPRRDPGGGLDLTSTTAFGIPVGLRGVCPTPQFSYGFNDD
jgi:hypothetical protein